MESVLKDMLKKQLSIVLFFVYALGFHSVGFAKPEVKGSPEELRQFLHPHDKIVTLSAEAEEKAYSDKALVSLVVTTEKDHLAKAIETNTQLRENISKQLIASGVKKDHIKTAKFSTSPQYGWFGKKPDSYKVANRMTITIVNENQMKSIAKVADENSEVNFSSTEFEHSKKDEFKNKVKTSALKKVMVQKSFYEKELGVVLTPVSFRDAHIGFQATRGAMEMDRLMVKAAPTSTSSIRVKEAKPRTSTFDEVKYHANISVEFKVEPKK